MEDDEGYTVLNLRPTRGNSTRPSPAGSQESPTSARCYRIALGACCIILTLAGIALGAWDQPRAGERQGSGISPVDWDRFPLPAGYSEKARSPAHDLLGREKIMDPAEKKLWSEVYPNIPGNPESEETPGNGRRCKLRKPAACTVAVTIVFVILITAVLALAVLVFKPQLIAWCPDGWIGYRGKCYYFSETENNWNNSQNNCSALSASLAVIDSNQEMAFMMRYKGVSEHWIGLWREQEGKPWKCVNGSNFNSLFQVRGGGDCAYLNDKGVSSSRCLTERNWVCSKPDVNTGQKNAMQRNQSLKIL